MSAQLLITHSGSTALLECTGEWLCADLSFVSNELQKLTPNDSKEIILDFSQLTRIDTVAATLLLHEKKRLSLNGCVVHFKNPNEQIEKTIELVLAKQLDERSFETAKKTYFSDFFSAVGRQAYKIKEDARQFLAFLGELFFASVFYLRNPSLFRFKAFANALETDGANALPIVIVSAFLVGVVVAYQAAVQLEKFGANLFIADMVCISVTRELSPLIVAIIIAGRSGSAYTAQLGSMKMTEELDAMRSFGFDPMKFLIIPKIVALSIALPLLIVVSDIVAILGGMLIAKLQLDLAPTVFLQRIYEAVSVRHFVIGVAKAPFFAALISSIACFRGLQTQPNTQSIGLHTTMSVVNAIFAVIACDALFSILLTRLKL